MTPLNTIRLSITKRKQGLLAKIVEHLDGELMKAENGGPGMPGEVVVQPTPRGAPEDMPQEPAPAPTAGLMDSGAWMKKQKWYP